MASRSDYKFPHIIRRDDDTTEAKVRFYEGEIATFLALDEPGEPLVSVTRYRRSALLREETFHFDRLVPDTALRGLMNAELAKDTTRTPIDGQAISVRP